MKVSLSPSAVAVLRQLVWSENLTKPALQQLLGISDASAFRSVEELSALGIIKQSATTGSHRGRPASRLSIKKDSFTSIAVTIEEDETLLSLVGADGEILSERSLEVNGRMEYAEAIKLLAQAIIEARSEAFQIAPLLSGVGVSFGGSVDSSSGVLLRPSRFPLWHQRSLGADLTLATGLRTNVDNDVSSLVRTLLWYGNKTDLKNLLLVNCSRGIGLGICLNGQVLSGEGNIPAGLAHTSSKYLPEREQQCECGRYNCLEMLYSLKALKRQLQIDPELGDREALQQIAKGRGNELLTRAGQAIAANALEIARCLDINLIVLTGPMRNEACFQSSFFKVVQEDQSNRRAHQRVVAMEEMLTHAKPATLAAATITLDEVFQERSFLRA